jgi:PKD repeat protein
MFSVMVAVVLNWLAASALAQGISIPDPGLDAAIRDTLHKPPPRRQKVRIHDPELAQQLSQQGAELIADYGSFQLFWMDDTLARTAFSLPGAEKADHQNIIALNARHLDTTTAEIKALRKSVLPSSGKQLHLVQFAGPIKPEWRDALEATGVRIITYIPQNAYLVYGHGPALGQMQAWAATADYVQWEGAYLDDYKIHPHALTIDEKGNPQKPATDLFAIQLVADEPANSSTLQLVDLLKSEPIKRQFAFQDYLNLVVRIPPERLPQLAAQPEVISIQPYLEPHKMDERQDIIMAGSLTGNGPTAPGYLAFLANKGFAQSQFTASGFAVDITDSGLDNGTTSPGHFGLYTLGDSSQPSRVIYNRLLGSPHPSSTLQGCDGHGTLNTHIIGGYNDQPDGFPHTDSAGYHYGLGVCPFVKFGSSVIFDPDTFTFPNFTSLQSQAYRDGARVSGNSWGADTAGAYTVDAQSYDALVRDAQPSGSTFPAAGNQEMVIVFAAGNAGSGGAQTVGAPGTAKNVITVGASENVRSMSTANGGTDPSGNTSCGVADSSADNANDLAFFSSRGPCADGRRKPELVAPGTHITGGVAQNSPPPSPSTTTGSAIACFKGTGVCALSGGGTVNNPNNFFPLNQQFYTTSSGTSHSTPAVAGSCALLRQFFINSGLNAPSPAMTKAFLMNSTRYLNGSGANDSLWSNNQGMGEVNLGMALDGTARIVRDELAADKFTGTGQSRTFAGTVADPSKPFRVTIAWTDAPGNTAGNAFNNDLDLTVTIGGNTFKGNVFSGANSVTGGSADNKNNAESVFLPAGVSGGFTVTVTAANINSDGVPNQAPSLDQDFALVVYNGTQVSAPVIAADSAAIVAESCSPNNGAPDPGETVTVNFGLRNVGVANSTNLVATLLATNGVLSPSAAQTYGALVAGGATVSESFTFTATGDCGTSISPTFQLQDGSQNLGAVSFSFVLGQLVNFFSENFDGVNAPSLPVGWTTAATGAQSSWVSSTASSDTSPNAAFSPDPGLVGLNELDSPVINLPATAAQLTFRHNYILEAPSGTTGFDGAVLEIKIGGGAFTDIVAAGGSFASGGYDHTISSDFGNPLAGRQAWSGNSGGFITTIVNLPASAQGQAIQLRWRCGTDNGVASTGWFVDAVSIQVRACCSQLSAPPSPSFNASPTNGQAPLTVTFTDTSTGTITNRFWNFGNGVTTNTSATSFSIVYPAAGTDTVSLTVSGPFGTDTLTRPGSILIFTNSPPTVAITSPANGASFIAPATITIQATASDSDGSVTNVQFFDGNTSLGNRSSSPFNLSVSLAVGSHALTAIASDNLGATKATPLPVTVTVTTNSPPAIAITSPTNGASFIAPATITIQAAASDSDGSVTNVQFFDGNTSLGNRSSSPFNLSVSLAVGSHALTAVASDNLGATKATPLPVAVTVTTNTPPTEVSIPDPGLNAAIRQALQKPAGALTAQDLLSLTNLDASGRNIRSLEGLETASNLDSLNLQSNQLSNFSLSNQFTNLEFLDLSLNSLTNCSFPGGLMKLATLNLEGNLLTSLNLPAGLNGLSSLELSENRFTSFNLPLNLTSLTFFDLGSNPLTNVSLPSGLTNLTTLVIQANNMLTNLDLPQGLTALETLDIDHNLLFSVSLPADLKSLTRLDLEGNQLFSLTLPTGMKNLAVLFLEGNHVGSLALPADMTKLAFLDVTGNELINVAVPGSLTALTNLDLAINRLSSFNLPAGLTNLTSLDLFENALTSFTLPDGLTALTNLNLAVNQLSSFAVPPDATNLATLLLFFNQSLTNLTLAPGMNNLMEISLSGDRLTNLALPPGLTNLSVLDLTGNQLTNLTLPLDMTNLATLVLDGNPLRTLTLSQQLAATNLAALVASLRNQGVSVIILQTGPNNPPVLAAIPNQTITVGTSLVITNRANDPDSPPQVLTFSLGNRAAPNASIDAASGVFSWTPTPAQVGTNTFDVKVIDDGQPPLSAFQSFSVVVLPANSPPTVAITSPTKGASFVAPATITIQAAASDSDGTVTNVQFFDGNTFLGNVSSSPYSLSVSLAVGSHALTAIASDNLGATTTTLPVTITGLTVIVISGATNLPNGSFQFAFTNTPGASFSVLTSTNLTTPVDEWTTMGAALETSPGSYQFTDETPTTPQRFYRVRSP